MIRPRIAMQHGRWQIKNYTAVHSTADTYAFRRAWLFCHTQNYKLFRKEVARQAALMALRAP